MKRIALAFLIVTTLYAGAKKPTQWGVNGHLNAYIKNDNIVGGGDSNLRERKGLTHNEEMNLNVAGPLKDGEAGINVRGRTTNDNRIQKDGAELLYFRGYYKDKAWNLEGGDVAASYNSYIFSSSLKGAKVVYKSLKKERTFNYSAIAGVKKASWKELYSNGRNETPTGYGGAFEIKYIHQRAKEIALSFATYNDDIHSGGIDSNVTGKKGYGAGLDGKWRFNKYVTLKGRGAVTTGTDNKRDHRADTTANAIQLRLYTRPILRSVKSNFIYQRVESDFISFGGTAAADKEQLENMTSWRINKEFNIRVDLKANRNNLDGKQTDGTTNSIYEALTCTYRPASLKRTTLTLRGTNKDIDNNAKDDNRKTARLDVTTRLKSGWRYGGGYEYSNYKDKKDVNSARRTNTFHALVGYKQKLSKVRSYRFTCRANLRNLRQSSGRQDTVGVKIDAGYIHNKRISADLAYMLNSTDNEVNNDINNNTYQFRAAYKLDDMGQNIVRLLLEKRDVSVDNTPNSSYDEYIEKLSLVMKF